MTIFKNANINSDINERTVELGDIGVRFYTMDENTSSLKININWNDKPVDLNLVNMTPTLSLFMQDGSIFEGETLQITSPTTGHIQYDLSPNVIKHVGTVQAKLFLQNDTESVHVANFSFTIVDSGVEEVVRKELSFNLVDAAVKEIVSQSAMELLDPTFQDDVVAGLQTYVETNKEDFRGSQGIPGIQGPKGDTGERGAVGPIGPTGLTGIQGPKGELGAVGPKGDTGATGAQGVKGDKGDIGARGPEGIQGPKGDNGKSVSYRDITLLNDLPLRFPGYDELVTSSGNGYYYPQGLALDDTYIYVLFSPSGAPLGDMKRLIVVYDKVTSEVVTKFYAGSAGGESIHVEVEGVSTFLYAKSKTSTLGKYDITNLPADMTVLVPVGEYNVGLYYNFTKNGNEWIIEQDSSTIKSGTSRELFAVYNSDLTTVKKYFTIDPTVGGLWGSDLNYDTPKRQGIVANNGNLLQVVGGNYYIGNEYTTYRAQGVQQLDSSGDIAENYAYNPNELAELLTSNGHTVTRIEHESGFVYNGDVYAMVVYNFEVPNTNGVNHRYMLVKYGADDFVKSMGASGEIVTTKNNQALMSPINGKLVNEFNGVAINSMKELVSYMYHTNRPQVLFYSSLVTINNEYGTTMDGGITVKIESASDNVYWVEYRQNRYVRKVMLGFDTSTEDITVYTQDVIEARPDVNLDTLLTSATFYGTNTTGGPTGASAHGFVEALHTGTNGQQIYRPYTDATRYFRFYKGGVWSAWVTL